MSFPGIKKPPNPLMTPFKNLLEEDGVHVFDGAMLFGRRSPESRATLCLLKKVVDQAVNKNHRGPRVGRCKGLRSMAANFAIFAQ